jgi:16S rRNA (guanine1516-N2)-methyltransferase
MLFYQNNKLVLDLPTFGKPLSVEFKNIEPVKNLLIAKAVGIKSQKQKISVLDISAGLGQDVYILYRLGCQIECVERSDIIGRLLEDGFKRYGVDIPLTICEAKSYLKKIMEKKTLPDVIYFDPIFPEKRKTALAQKSARILKAIVGEDKDSEEVFELALTAAKNRVVVKRGLNSPRISSRLEPDIIFKGKVIRFDVYLI